MMASSLHVHCLGGGAASLHSSQRPQAPCSSHVRPINMQGCPASTSSSSSSQGTSSQHAARQRPAALQAASSELLDLEPSISGNGSDGSLMGSLDAAPNPLVCMPEDFVLALGEVSSVNRTAAETVDDVFRCPGCTQPACQVRCGAHCLKRSVHFPLAPGGQVTI